MAIVCQIVVVVSRLLRTVHSLLSLCEWGFDQDAQRVLGHQGVLDALGPNGQAFAGELQQALQGTLHLLQGRECKKLLFEPLEALHVSCLIPSTSS